MVELIATKSPADIRSELLTEMTLNNPGIPEAAAKVIIEDTTKFLECGFNHGQPIDPGQCMFCHYGHMTECHYPFTCEEAQCSHFTGEPK